MAQEQHQAESSGGDWTASAPPLHTLLASTNEKWGLPPGPASAPSPNEVLLGDLEDRCNLPLKRTPRDERGDKVVKLKRSKEGAGLKGLAGERQPKASESEEGRQCHDGARGGGGDKKTSDPPPLRTHARRLGKKDF